MAHPPWATKHSDDVGSSMHGPADSLPCAFQAQRPAKRRSWLCQRPHTLTPSIGIHDYNRLLSGPSHVAAARRCGLTRQLRFPCPPFPYLHALKKTTFLPLWDRRAALDQLQPEPPCFAPPSYHPMPAHHSRQSLTRTGRQSTACPQAYSSLTTYRFLMTMHK